MKSLRVARCVPVIDKMSGLFTNVKNVTLATHSFTHIHSLGSRFTAITRPFKATFKHSRRWDDCVFEIKCAQTSGK